MHIESFLVGKGTLEAFMPLLGEEVREMIVQTDCLIVGASVDDQAAGVAVLLVDEETRNSGQIIHLLVSDRFRRMGVGTQLLNRCLRVLRQFAVSSMDCVVIGEESEGAGKGDLEEFLTAWGMNIDMDEGIAGSFTLDDVSEAGKLGENDHEACIPLGCIDRRILDSSLDYLTYNGNWQQPDQELSFGYVTDQKLRAVFLITESFGRLSVDWMEIEKGCNPKWLIALMECSLSTAKKKYPGETAVTYSAWNESAIKLINYLLGSKANTKKVSHFSVSDEEFRLKEV